MFLDQTDITKRLYSLVPNNWFGDLVDSPDLNGVLSMMSAIYANGEDGAVEFLRYLQRQTRVTTAEGFWLDMIAEDYFGRMIQRFGSESDASLRRRILMNLLAPRGTRCAVSSATTNLTGYTPRIIELRNPGDCGAYTTLDNPQWGGFVYNEIGSYGTMRMPFQMLVNATRPPGEGIPLVNGYSMSGGGYATYPKPFGYVGSLRPQNFGTGSYAQLIDIIGQVTDDEIYATIARSMPAGTIAWTSISSIQTPIPGDGGAMLDSNFFLDLSLLASDDAPPLGGAKALMEMRLAGLANIRQGEAFADLMIPILISGNVQSVASGTATATLTLPLTAKGLGTAALSVWTMNMAMKANINVLAKTLASVSSATSIGVVRAQVGHSATRVSSAAQLGLIVHSILGAPVSTSLTSVSSPSAIGRLLLNNSSIFSVPIAQVSAGSAVGVMHFNIDGFVNVSLTSRTSAMSLGTMNLTVSNNPSVTSRTSVASLGTIAHPTISKTLTSRTSVMSLGSVTAQRGVPQTWSSTARNANISLSSGNVIATHNATVSDDSVYSTNYASTGKNYWELIVTCSDITQISAGLGNTDSDFSDGTYVGGELGSIGWIAASGEVQANGTTVSTWATFASGDRVCFAVDLDAHLIWARKGNGLWNNSGTANPATGVGGVGLTANVYAFPMSPGVTLFTNDSAHGYFQVSDWVFTPPSGFVAW